MRQLADPALDGRAPASAGDRAARAAVVERFSCLGLTPAADDGGFEQGFAVPQGDTANVLATLPGDDPSLQGEIVLVMAHHDHLGAGHLGANDNASGLAAMLGVAAALAQAGPGARTVAFAAFGAEEQGLLGSSFLLAHPPRSLPPGRVVHVLNLDMIGSYSTRQRVHVFGARRGAPATALLRALVRAHPRTRFALGGESTRGDHHGFAELGIPYSFFWTPDGRCYHRRCDRAARIDYLHLADIAAVAAALTTELAAAPR